MGFPTTPRRIQSPIKKLAGPPVLPIRNRALSLAAVFFATVFWLFPWLLPWLHTSHNLADVRDDLRVIAIEWTVTLVIALKALLRRGRGYRDLNYLLLKAQRLAAAKTEFVAFQKAA